MFRCLELARHGAGFVSPNPMVGAVLVYQNRIIGEGWHQMYGGPHAEVNCIRSVSQADEHLIPNSTLYVSLEPCAHFGKTPPCSHLIIEKKIHRVVVACSDPFEAVNGKGIQLLEQAGIEVMTGVLEKEAMDLNNRFFCFHQQNRPYIILKWAQSSDGFIAGISEDRLLITHEQTNRLVHRWRSEEAAILIGTETAIKDNPSLTNRYWLGKSPLRLVVDRQLRLPENLVMFRDGNPVIIFNEQKNDQQGELRFVKINTDQSFIDQLFVYCYQNGVQSILVEGGAKLLQSFIDADQWDEARIITNTTLQVGSGLPAPMIKSTPMVHSFTSMTDQINMYIHPKTKQRI
ncbi:MAG: bifunctional diaminohydroxyphosphoribosylaminopyrimidine deaminase/5-amino-6-(5-phosphoribosylamino)uracil reductase RibD [Sediminibacterium sp. Gen4]|uniref:bifunctional diaminohydroxyphosphoribosylaminopyrimidine deaminase/5-amino-6-(5-phosphoribosylamino)uracil reductase RibD n=1 Tax=unclassified Sediminibacterium TaxID=2635961 RepID=UPI0015B8B551|nr:bifunctional diaminohydroxyphosphoribosylaminopyrimidine deaminase/5-amino-6-(5-phosphoribosylamino)uracil reductase RibD [Sediminibacterium sp.]MBW0165839.1 bifunctional diaminohydroxyphosphoribosylaminopyrimidine deaminase/5-amino-6-(5-phosphoribosylamino)uracil reductase RibD [Sediminibacterium sp.]NWK64806.1 bifunctional diaminohydroxyphosphoribosylaminopyrimidine deaminase/5-amino-6-(5-phosphoribosylamino)uracil reductase RibD [Sediminibacterium sp. Gen4]